VVVEECPYESKERDLAQDSNQEDHAMVFVVSARRLRIKPPERSKHEVGSFWRQDHITSVQHVHLNHLAITTPTGWKQVLKQGQNGRVTLHDL